MEKQLFVLLATKFMEKKLKMETSCEMPRKGGLPQNFGIHVSGKMKGMTQRWSNNNCATRT